MYILMISDGHKSLTNAYPSMVLLGVKSAQNSQRLPLEGFPL